MTVRGIADHRFQRLVLQNIELIKGGPTRRLRPELLPIDPDDTRSAPFANLCHRRSNAAVCADDQQGLAGSNPGIFNHPYPGGEVDDTCRRSLFQGQRARFASKTRDWNRDPVGVAAIDRISNLAARSPYFRTNSFGGTQHDCSGIVAPRHAGQSRMFHLPLDIVESLGSIEAAATLRRRLPRPP